MMHTKYILTAVLMLLSTNCLATIYTIGGSTQPLIVANDITNVLNDSIMVPGSNFTMFSPVAAGIGKVLNNPDTPSPYQASGTTEDVVGNLNDTLICFDIGCTDISLNFSTVTLFSGNPWVTHDIRVFGPGTYVFDTCLLDGSTTCTPGDPTTIATLEVGPGQLGAQVFFDWSGNNNIDVFLLWEANATYTRPDTSFFPPFGVFLAPAETRTYGLASRDVDGDGNAGSNMTDGPFKGHNASFSFFLNQPIAIPAKPVLTITQPGNAGASTGVVDTSGAPVTISASNTPAANLSFDWNVAVSPKYKNNSDMYPPSSAPLITANTNGTASNTFVFDPTDAALLPGSTYSISLRVTNTDNGLSDGKIRSLLLGCPADSALPGVDTDGDGVDDVTEACADTDGDGILEYLDPFTYTATQVSVDLATRTIANSNTGVLSIGNLASISADSAGNIGAGIGVSITDIVVVDSAVARSCVGGCFDFTVTGGALAGAGTSASVVVPLSEPVPERAIYKKFAGSAWATFNGTSALDSVNSAASVASVCPAPGDVAYSNGLVAGDDCLQIMIEDNGPNDADVNVGSIADPGGIGQLPVTVTPPPPTTKIDGGVFGCSATQTPVKWTERGELLLLFGFIAWLGLVRRKQA